MLDYRRTHNCGTLNSSHIGTTVTLSGWVQKYRDHGGLIFIDLRDRFGLTQLVFDPEKNKAAHHIAEALRQEWVISITGTVIPRSAGMANSKLATGEIEVEVAEIRILSKAKTPPFSISDETLNVNEELRLKYRYLDIRRGHLMKNLVLRHKAVKAARHVLDGLGFLDIQTPALAKSTPEGSRDYLVPSRISPGHFYALPQSPQLFKQLLMIAGADRYFQIVTCFRDEDNRADRQPEFTQIDIEMSFGKPDDIMAITEELLKAIFKETIGRDIETPFRRISHAESMEKYGTDRPDLRYGMAFFNLNDIADSCSFTVFRDQRQSGGIVKGLTVPGGADISRKAIDNYTAFVAHFGVKGLAWIKVQEDGLASSIVKFFSDAEQKLLIERSGAKVGDLIFMIADTSKRTNQALDHLRRTIAKDRGLIKSGHYEFVWVDEFPLFAFDDNEKRLVSEHHPFTSPTEEDIARLDSDPLTVRSLGYDIVLNGSELGGGSQRIHDPELQHKIFERLSLTQDEIKEKFGFFIDAMSYGTPPHLGIALGLDRIIMLLAETDNIRDVIAFPKTQRAADLMMDSPSPVNPLQLKELKLSVEDPEFIKEI